MAPATIIDKTLINLVEDFIARSPFFKSWRLGSVDKDMTERFLVTFDFLVQSFPSLIAAGAARAQDEKTRSVLAINLYQECGEGDLSRTHHAIYRKFLKTAGIDLGSVAQSPFALRWHHDLFSYINGSASPAAALGALTAGEFLARPALTRIYAVLLPHYPKADQEYFTKHLALEEEHVREITHLLAQQQDQGGSWEEIQEGFRYGLKVWGDYFQALAGFLVPTTQP